MDDEYRLIDGNYSDRAVAFCKTKHGYLTPRMIKVHRCLRIQCTGLERMDCEFWELRKRKKDAQKQRKSASTR